MPSMTWTGVLQKVRSRQDVARTTGYLLGFPATLFLSTVLRALRGLMSGVENGQYQAYVLRLKTYYGLQRR
jgi:hypothetical protein